MLKGIDIITGLEIDAEKGLIAICQFCNGELIPKCGDVKIHHWAHKPPYNCDKWWEPETDWHRFWKSEFGKEYSEIIIIKDGIKHVADVQTKTGWVIEFQNSAISDTTIIAREEFYSDKMIWVINGLKFKDNFKVKEEVFDDDYIYKEAFKQTFNLIPEVIDRFLSINFDKLDRPIIYLDNNTNECSYYNPYLISIGFDYNSNEEYYWKEFDNDYLNKKQKYQDERLKANRDSLIDFKWKRTIANWYASERKKFIDFGSKWLFEVDLYSEKAKVISKEEFIREYRG